MLALAMVFCVLNAITSWSVSVHSVSHPEEQLGDERGKDFVELVACGVSRYGDVLLEGVELVESEGVGVA